MAETRKSGNLVVPGEKLGVIEEFIPDSGTYEENGIIHSKRTGYVLMDYKNKKLSVYPKAHNLNVPKIGGLVVGEVTGVQNSMATVRIFKVEKKLISGSFTGMIHVSDTNFSYTENMFDAFRVTDIVRAKVISDKNGVYHLSTKGETLGVLQSFCSKCGGSLAIKGNKLQCDKCENVESRKLASDYDTGNL